MRTLKVRTYTGTKDPAVTQRELDNRALARLAAAEGFVLLKNEKNLLPLAEGSSVALYGIGAGKTIKGGTGSGDVNERDSVTIYQGMMDAGFAVTTEDWIREYDARYEAARMEWRDGILERTEGMEGSVGFFEVYSTTPFVMPEAAPVTKTEAEVAVYVLSRIAGEGADRYAAAGDYYLTEAEHEMLASICTLYPHVVVAVNAGGLVDLSFLDEFPQIEVLLHILQPGMEGGHAFADVLLGHSVPCGKLVDTWAFGYKDYPSSANFSHNNGNVDKEYYEDGIYVGYRYFDTFDVPVRYGFGYGLSYTTFKVKGTMGEIDPQRATVMASVTNTGAAFSGKEVVQVYVTCPAGKLAKEYRRLVGFAKTDLLAPGESQTLQAEVPLGLLASYDEAAPGWILEAGDYVFWVGSSLAEAKPVGVVRLDETAVLSETRNICPLQEELHEIQPEAAAMEAKRAALAETIKNAGLPVLYLYKKNLPYEKVNYHPNRELVPAAARAWTETLSDEELIALATGDPAKGQGSNLGSAGISVPGSAGETNDCCLEKGLASIVLADGPAGLRLNRFYNVHEDKIVWVPFQFALEGGIFCPGLAEQLPGDRYYQYCTAIPVGTLLAQTWDTALIRKIGQMIGGEMQLFNTTLWLAPGMNIHRNPLCGRNFEYYSEDPLVAGRMAAAMTDGVQSVPGCGTTIKHFACNNQEDNRMGVDSILSERALREIYLKGFEIAVREAQPMSIMTSYNLINGVHAANNADTCTNAVRNEWGFRGVIMTDWCTTLNGPDCTAAGCMRAGNDLVMPGEMIDRENLEKEFAEGSLSRDDLVACVARLVNIIWQSNMYEGAEAYNK